MLMVYDLHLHLWLMLCNNFYYKTMIMVDVMGCLIIIQYVRFVNDIDCY